ncbi:hypothetical protein BGZ61DRAFT_473718 [Ilyonectria robusta]|uniref:uncharacterized protein n=1 Tax=Ilyonectria robusta TaxID=1079257 RepID=UPI001E8EAD85|nr:uncharacterized protein BGZ61DRAFT_473718 [Ilyonectria robusta]KAH8735075.1 hypothetical protein BGZ61DRAFT_473718 [Ilyonectria robusta]
MAGVPFSHLGLGARSMGWPGGIVPLGVGVELGRKRVMEFASIHPLPIGRRDAGWLAEAERPWTWRPLAVQQHDMDQPGASGRLQTSFVALADRVLEERVETWLLGGQSQTRLNSHRVTAAGREEAHSLGDRSWGVNPWDALRRVNQAIGKLLGTDPPPEYCAVPWDRHTTAQYGVRASTASVLSLCYMCSSAGKSFHRLSGRQHQSSTSTTERLSSEPRASGLITKGTVSLGDGQIVACRAKACRVLPAPLPAAICVFQGGIKDFRFCPPLKWNNRVHLLILLILLLRSLAYIHTHIHTRPAQHAETSNPSTRVTAGRHIGTAECTPSTPRGTRCRSVGVLSLGSWHSVPRSPRVVEMAPATDAWPSKAAPCAKLGGDDLWGTIRPNVSSSKGRLDTDRPVVELLTGCC